MTELEQLQQTKKEYVQTQAQKIIDAMVKYNRTTDTLATCDASGWDTELHRNMDAIVVELKNKGINTKSSVNWGVTDWVFTIA